MSIDKYLKDPDIECPFCDSGESEGHSMDFFDGNIYQKKSCLNCGKDWIDSYQLVGVIV